MKTFRVVFVFVATLVFQLSFVETANAGSWSTTGALISARYRHTTTLLQNGKVLIAGGYGPGYLSSAELYDPATGTCAATASMTTNRSQHTATLLKNGKVLVVGGYVQVGFDSVTLRSAEVYDSVAGTWTLTGSMANARYGHTATLLADGRV